MDVERLKEALKAASKNRAQLDPYTENAVRTIIRNLPETYNEQVNETVLSSLFQLCRSSGKEEHYFVLQFMPTLIWIYLSVMTGQDRKGCGKLEAILLAVYNSVLDKGEPQQSFRLPSLSRPSLYHEPTQFRAGSSALTEMALSRHEQSDVPVIYPGPGQQLNRIAAVHRQAVLSGILKQYNSSLIKMTQDSQLSYCMLALRVSRCGFKERCKSNEVSGNNPFNDEELSKLRNHPRINLSPELLHQLTQGMYILRYNGQSSLAASAIDELNFRASHSLLAPAHLLTRSIRRSLQAAGATAHDRPLGLEVLRSEKELGPSGQVPPGRPLKACTGDASSLAALTTDGLGVKRGGLANEYATPNANEIPSDNFKARSPTKHQKSQSLGHFKAPPLVSKEDIELQFIPRTYSGSEPGSSKKSSSDKQLSVLGPASSLKTYSQTEVRHGQRL